MKEIRWILEGGIENREGLETMEMEIEIWI